MRRERWHRLFDIAAHKFMPEEMRGVIARKGGYPDSAFFNFWLFFGYVEIEAGGLKSGENVPSSSAANISHILTGFPLHIIWHIHKMVIMGMSQKDEPGVLR